MKLILLGAAGSGKGTQGAMISEKYNIPNISTGDLFRANMKNKTPIGLKAEGYINAGKLVPDEVVLEMLKARLKDKDCKNGFILDGFPRNAAQAAALEKIAKIDKVISITLREDILLSRITGRRLCEKCGNNSHIDWPNGATTCPKCGGAMLQRKDDADEEAVRQRLRTYEESVKPLVGFYKQKGILSEVSGDKGKEDLFRQISQVLEK